MRKHLTLVSCVLALALGGASTAAAAPRDTAPTGSWASSQITAVVAAGLMAPSAAEFRPQDPLTRGELAELMTGLGSSLPAAADPAAPVTVAELDAALVRALGLSQTAAKYRSALAAAGLQPPKRAGTEVVARELGLRPNHSPETAELGPNDPATRAEAAYSVAKALALRAPGAWQVGSIKSQAAAFALPELTAWQRRILTRAVSFVGYPYVWAGSSERRQTLGAGPAPGGFDCSGFVWRVYKLEQYPDAPQLAAVLKGRTTYVMSAEFPAAQRVARPGLAPADLVFFGDSGTKSKPAEIGHMGIYLGNGYFIHSSSGRAGVTISTLSGWYADRFAWGRRPLVEAGLDGGPVTAPPAQPETPEAPPQQEAPPAAPETPVAVGDGQLTAAFGTG